MDREKVVKGLHCRAQDLMIDLPACDDCGYQIQMVNRRGCDYRQICKDALALLKEQQEQIEQMNFIYGFVYGGQVKEIKKLVRCNECRHRDPEDHKCDCGHDIQWQLPRADDWFCADGEDK